MFIILWSIFMFQPLRVNRQVQVFSFSCFRTSRKWDMRFVWSWRPWQWPWAFFCREHNQSRVSRVGSETQECSCQGHFPCCSPAMTRACTKDRPRIRVPRLTCSGRQVLCGSTLAQRLPEAPFHDCTAVWDAAAQPSHPLCSLMALSDFSFLSQTYFPSVVYML